MRFTYLGKKRTRCSKSNQNRVITTLKVSVKHCSDVNPDEFEVIQARGVAYRHPSDKFDMTFGKRLSETRAKRMIFKKSVTAVSRVLKKKMREVEELQRTLKKQQEYLDKEIEHENLLLHSQH